MAYRNLISVACTNRAEVFKRLRDFVCRRNGSYDYSTTGIGWTLFDSSYAVDENTISTNDWFVIYSPGESGTDDLYFRFTYIANYIVVAGFLYWNASTNAGVEQYGGNNQWNIADADVPVLWIYGDLDSVVGISRENSTSSSYDEMDFGRLVATGYDLTIATCASALSSGTDISIDVGTVPSTWAVGDKVFIRDTVRSALITIKTKTSSAITADLSTAFLANSKLSAEIGYYAPYNASSLMGTISCMINNDGTKNSLVYSAQANTLITTAATEPLKSGFLASRIFVLGSPAGYKGYKKHILARTPTGVTVLNAYSDQSGNNYRAFTTGGNTYSFVKEV